MQDLARFSQMEKLLKMIKQSTRTDETDHDRLAVKNAFFTRFYHLFFTTSVF